MESMGLPICFPHNENVLIVNLIFEKIARKKMALPALGEREPWLLGLMAPDFSMRCGRRGIAQLPIDGALAKPAAAQEVWNKTCVLRLGVEIIPAAKLRRNPMHRWSPCNNLWVAVHQHGDAVICQRVSEVIGVSYENVFCYLCNALCQPGLGY